MTIIEDLDQVAFYAAQLIGTDWGRSGGIIYIQEREMGRADLVGNPALGAQMEAGIVVSMTAVGTWIKAVAAAQPVLTVYTASLPLLETLLNVSTREQWGVPLRRLVRIGECQGAGNFGNEPEEDAAFRMLGLDAVQGNQLAIVEVAGSDGLLFVGTTFTWDDMGWHNLKSCEPIDLVCRAVIPQIAAKKGLLRILVAGEELFEALTKHPNLAAYHRLFVLREDPDARAVSIRKRVISQVRLQANVFSASNSGSWLQRERARLGLGGAPDAGASSLRERTSQVLELYFQATNSSDDNELARVLEVARPAISETTWDGRLMRAIESIVQSKLGVALSPEQWEELLAPGAEHELWWEDAVHAELIAFSKRTDPGPWIAQLGERGVQVLSRAATSSDAAYARIHREIRNFDSGRTIGVGCFETLDAYRAGEESLTAARALLLATTEEVPSEGESVSQSPQWNDRCRFYWRLAELVHPMELSALRALGDAALRRWGPSMEHLEFQVDLEISHSSPDYALEQMKALSIEHPESAYVWMARGRCEQRLAHYDAAIASYSHSTCDATEPEVLRAISRCHDLAGRTEQAILVWAGVLPEHLTPECRLMLAQLHHDVQQYSVSMDLLSHIDSADLEESMLRLYVLNAVALNEVSAVLSVVEPHRSRFSESAWPRLVADVAELLACRDQQVAALEAFLNMLEFDANWSPAVSTLASILAQSGRLEEADALYCKLHEQNGDVFTERAGWHFHHRDYEASYRIARDGLARFPEELGLLTIVGELQELVDVPTIDAFGSVIALVSAMPIYDRGNFENFQLVVAYANTGKAHEAMTKFLELRQPSPYRLLYSALVAALANEPEKVAERYSLAVSALSRLGHVDRRAVVRLHLSDINVYGQRGLLNAPDALTAQAGACLAAASQPVQAAL
jgi:tetratricopeptide (TPR) repeat protein